MLTLIPVMPAKACDAKPAEADREALTSDENWEKYVENRRNMYCAR